VAIDFCRVFYCTTTLQGCAETAALYASGTAQPPPNTAATDAATQAAVAAGAGPYLIYLQNKGTDPDGTSQSAALANGYANGSTTSQAEVNIPPQSGTVARAGCCQRSS
jgi:hypothetical protein